MRIFQPQIMERPHWHGHVEANFARNCRLHYIIDGELVVVEPGRLILFWAGVPHQLVEIEPTNEFMPELSNIYLPLDSFLFMPFIHDLQVAVLTGGMVQMRAESCRHEQLQNWYADYRSNHPERHDVFKMELNALFRRMSLEPLAFLRNPWRHNMNTSTLASEHVRHVVSMVQFALDHLSEPIKNADVAKVTGLHTNYALALFSSTMSLPLKQFIIRMRLLRARGLLLESNAAISTVALESGFGSMSQFYDHFTKAYGITPHTLRDNRVHSKVKHEEARN